MDLLDRLHDRLSSALEQADPRPARPTIAEIYQQLIPYRAVRDALALDGFAEYEHALLRLLAGERGYARVESDAARTDLQRELASANPILGVYRDHPDACVRLLPGGSATVAPSTSAEDAAAQMPPETEPRREETPPISVTRASAAVTEPAICARCERTLPDRPDAAYCPFCGAPTGVRHCLACDARVEGGWSFCTRCGSAAP